MTSFSDTTPALAWSTTLSSFVLCFDGLWNCHCGTVGGRGRLTGLLAVSLSLAVYKVLREALCGMDKVGLQRKRMGVARWRNEGRRKISDSDTWQDSFSCS